jgi:hypothetical protein
MEMFQVTGTQENSVAFRHFNDLTIQSQVQKPLMYDDELKIGLPPRTKTAAL